MVSVIYSMGIEGINGFKVKIECDVSPGMPLCNIVGLPDVAVKEAKNRVQSAITNCGMAFPLGRITVNLAPADVKKSGSLYDLPILLAILEASGQIQKDFLKESAFIGELSLSGDVCGVFGIISMTMQAKKLGFKNIFVPYGNAKEASLIGGINVFGIKHISELLDPIKSQNLKPYPKQRIVKKPLDPLLDFSEIKGQYEAKRAVEIAVAGGHNILMIGPPGSGKSMISKHVASILPEMTFEEMLETTAIHSVAGMIKPDEPIITNRPFRSPHYNISVAGLIGGGTNPRPGEISLAHNGILFLDELAEFSRESIEALRQPLEDGTVTISRVRSTVTFPCSFMLIAAMNPCPCGYYGHPTKPCFCSKNKIERYLSKISGPILDRIDIHIEVPPINFEEFSSDTCGEKSPEIASRIIKAREVQLKRYSGKNIFSNAKMPQSALKEVCVLTPEARSILKNAFNRMGLSARAGSKILKVARTIADLNNEEKIGVMHIAEAIQFRSLNKKYPHLFS